VVVLEFDNAPSSRCFGGRPRAYNIIMFCPKYIILKIYIILCCKYTNARKLIHTPIWNCKAYQKKYKKMIIIYEPNQESNLHQVPINSLIILTSNKATQKCQIKSHIKLNFQEWKKNASLKSSKHLMLIRSTFQPCSS
jgi:hypothetical protein